MTENLPGGLQHPGVYDPSRTLMGDAQEQLLFQRLASSSAQWNVIAQQRMMAQYDYDPSQILSVNHDQWDGYVVSRNRLTNFINQQNPANPVILSGDWHAAFVNDVLLDHADPGSKVVATEFVGTSISSGCGWAQAIKNCLPANPHTHYISPDKRGWTRCTVTPEEVRSDCLVVASAADPRSPAVVDASFVVRNGQPGAQRA